MRYILGILVSLCVWSGVAEAHSHHHGGRHGWGGWGGGGFVFYSGPAYYPRCRNYAEYLYYRDDSLGWDDYGDYYDDYDYRWRDRRYFRADRHEWRRDRRGHGGYGGHRRVSHGGRGHGGHHGR